MLFEKKRIDQDANIDHSFIGAIPSMPLKPHNNYSNTVFLLISARSQYSFTFKTIGYIP